MSLFSSYQASGYVLTSSLVESLYHVVPEYRDRSSSFDHRTVESTLRKAENLLSTLSQTVGAAFRAFRALRCVLKSDEGQAESIYEYQGLPAFGSNGMPQSLFDKIPSLSDELWDMSETRQLHDWLDNPVEDSTIPSSSMRLQNPIMSTNPNGAQGYNSFQATSTENAFPARMYDPSPKNVLECFDLDLGRSQPGWTS